MNNSNLYDVWENIVKKAVNEIVSFFTLQQVFLYEKNNFNINTNHTNK